MWSALTLIAIVAAGAVPTPVGDDDCRWRTPVAASIVDTFRPPDDPFGPGGNRGLEYGTVGGELVSAVADGEVTFVGPVGGRRWVVVLHRSGLRSTLGPMAATTVVSGQPVAVGQAVGEADPGLHLTARTR